MRNKAAKVYQIKEEELLRDVVRRVLIAAEPEGIILCGSRARGTGRPDSDLDLLMIDRAADRRDLRPLYHAALKGIRLPKNIFIENPETVAGWRNVHNHFLTGLVREGRILYERRPGLMAEIGPSKDSELQRHDRLDVYTVTEEQLQKAVDSIVELGPPQKVVLFGSRAKGTEKPDSDVDLLIIDTDRTSQDVYSQATESLDAPVDVIVRTPLEVAAWRNVSNHFLTKVVREGRVLYERPSEFDSESVPANDHADHARELFRLGDRDFEAAELLLKAEGHHRPTCFYLEQAIERYLKAILAYDGADIPRSHNLERLRYLLAESPRRLDIDPGVDLMSPFATNARYGEDLRASTEFANSAVQLARKIREVIARELPPEALPASTVLADDPRA